MKLYHGSTESSIAELCPRSKDKEGNPVLYLTDHYAYSLFYLRDRETDYVTCGVREDGKVHYDEWFPDQLKILYEGRSGWIYEAEADAEPHRTRGIQICRSSVTVTQKYCIENAYSAIQEEIRKGTVVVRFFAEMPKELLQQYREGLVRMLRIEKNLSAAKKEFYQTYFPECWEAISSAHFQ